MFADKSLEGFTSRKLKKWNSAPDPTRCHTFVHLRSNDLRVVFGKFEWNWVVLAGSESLEIFHVNSRRFQRRNLAYNRKRYNEFAALVAVPWTSNVNSVTKPNIIDELNWLDDHPEKIHVKGVRENCDMAALVVPRDKAQPPRCAVSIVTRNCPRATNG